jgi:hypothetical protein
MQTSDLMTLLPKQRLKIPRMLNYVEEIIPMYTEEEFRRRFRLMKATFVSILSMLLQFKGKTIFSTEKQLLIFIGYLTNQMTIQVIADEFGVCEFSF